MTTSVNSVLTRARKIVAWKFPALLVLTLFLPVVALLARLSAGTVAAGALPSLLALLQVTSGGLGMQLYGVAVLAAVHPVSAMAMASLWVLLLVFGWMEGRPSALLDGSTGPYAEVRLERS
jgi:hypothetical protein